MMSKNKKLDVDALVKGRLSIDILTLAGFVDIPDKKQALHPSRYFKALFLPKLKAKGLSDMDIFTHLGIPELLYLDFLGEKVSITSGFANKLEALTGMRAEFWLRAQGKFDVLTEDKSAVLNVKAESDELIKQSDSSELQEKLKVSKIAGAAKGILSHIKANQSISDEESILQAIERVVEEKKSSKNDKS